MVGVHNQDLFDVDWFLVRLHPSITPSIQDLTWPLVHISNLFKDLTKRFKEINYVFLCVFRTLNMDFSVCSCVCLFMCAHVLEWLHVRLFTVCAVPCVVASCAVLGLILGCWCVMCLGLWLCRRCDVYLCLWGIAVTAFFNWPKLLTEVLVPAK